MTLPPNTACTRTPATPATSSRGRVRWGWRGGSLRVFKHFARLEVDSVKIGLSQPTHQRVTQAVRRLSNGHVERHIYV
jgi:hypothetical protein